MHYATLPLRTSQGMMSNVFGNGIAIITMQVPITELYSLFTSLNDCAHQTDFILTFLSIPPVHYLRLLHDESNRWR